MRIYMFRKVMWGYRSFMGTKALDLGFFTIYWR